MKKNLYAETPFEQQPRPDTALLKKKLILKKPQNSASCDTAPLVTVVTAVFNAVKEGRKEELLQCLNSVQMQTGTTIEHLIIDGASQDGTLELIRDYPNKKVPVRVLSEPDAGIYDAMNRGLWLAQGQYVIFLNSDDYYSDPRGLAESVRCLQESSADFSYAPVSVLSETTGLPVPHLISQPNINMIFVEMPFSHQSMMFRREVLLEINGFDLRYSSGADYDSVLRLILTEHRACSVPVSFVAFRLGGFSFVNVGQSQQEVGTIFSRLYKQYLKADLTPEEGRQIYMTKQAPKELRKLQFHFAKAAFGEAVDPVDEPVEDPVLDELLILRYRLQLLKNHPGAAESVRILALLLFSNPVLFGRFLLKYFRLCRKLGKHEAGKQAYLDLFSDIKTERMRQMTAGGNTLRPAAPTLPRRAITHQDFWHTNGLFAGEPWGSWSGREFSVFFKIPEENIGQELELKIYIGGYVFPDSPVRTIQVVVNGQSAGVLTADNIMPQPHSFTIPGEAVTAADLDIDFIVDRTFVPKELGCSEDTRELGMTFWKLSVCRSREAAKRPDPAEAAEIKVGFLNHFNKWWVGGITYFKNLFQAMETTESPRLKPFIFPSPDELADCLKPYTENFPDPPQKFTELKYLPTAEDYRVDVLSHLNGNQVTEGRDGIAWIADFQHIHLPEMFDEQEIAFRNHSFHTLIEQNRIVCLSSFDAMEDFKKYAPESAGKARCLHFVSIPEKEIFQITDAEAAEIRRRRKLPERYFYVPNQFWKHKNHIAVLKAIAILKESGLPVHVVFSGNTMDARFPHYFEELEAFCKEAEITENVHFLGLIPLKEVYFLMRDCLAMINPSRFEGWSSSVEESKSIGKRIFLSNLNVHYEQMPPCGTYFPCDDPDWLADLLRRAWSELKPGPDAELEKQAREALPGRIREFGNDFRKIVLEAMGSNAANAAKAAPEPIVTVVTVIRDLLKSGLKEQIVRNLESVASQRDIEAEHLIIDGGSTDGTLEFLRHHAENFHCRILSAPDHGVGEAMNRGAIHARGKYITYLHAGDFYVSDTFLKDSVLALEKSQADFSYGPVQMLDPAGALPEKPCQTEPDERGCFTGMPFTLQSMLFRRKVFYSVAGVNDTLRQAGEFDLLLRLILSGKKAIRVRQTGVGVKGCAGSAERQEAFLQECGRISSRLYGRIGCPVTPEAMREILTGKCLPEALKEILQPYWDKTFGHMAAE